MSVKQSQSQKLKNQSTGRKKNEGGWAFWTVRIRKEVEAEKDYDQKQWSGEAENGCTTNEGKDMDVISSHIQHLGNEECMDTV